MPKTKQQQPAAAAAPADATVEDVPETETRVTEAIGETTHIDEATIKRATELVREQARALDKTRGERKARKVFEGLGLVPVDGITRVVFKRPRNELIIIAEPEVYKSANADVYIVHGVATMGNGNLSPQAMMAERMARQQHAQMMRQAAAGGHAGHVHDENCSHGHAHDDEAPEAVPEAAADATEFDAADIELVMNQGNVSREKAVEALRKNKGDAVNALTELAV
ncbi:hypothetical protein AMAG_02571 [Allomyces macrogynus ATCC 38327]|uniref:Nascent polypeptide-associated complex subunit alpha n=1 Tax=Allomyces macrogynus (strain ATCC 38327) TaxID=578462 RepID=A0A0L0S309_ALLM3|nr:hypothetical protein AMAG_02571 [Allomyces macrogynus ATCC 38327]|eukprot:KNE56795.1 hypothetical protein AMAG_02571 [Allomyces macrogynus ATCC 38327]